jgi:hypothetical protein
MHPSTLFLLIVALGGANLAHAADEDADDAPTPRYEAALGASANDAPRFIRNDSAAEPARSAPGYRAETTELGRRWWLSNGRADVGMGLGTISYVSRPTGSLPGLGPTGSANALAAGTVLTLGMRYRTSERSAIYGDAAGVQGVGVEGGQTVVGKVGVEFKSARSRFDIAYGGLGLQLAGDARMTVKVRRGGLGLYMRSAF